MTTGFYIEYPDHDTLWRYSIFENGIDTNYAERPLNEANNTMPSLTK